MPDGKHHSYSLTMYKFLLSKVIIFIALNSKRSWASFKLNTSTWGVMDDLISRFKKQVLNLNNKLQICEVWCMHLLIEIVAIWCRLQLTTKRKKKRRCNEITFINSIRRFNIL